MKATSFTSHIPRRASPDRKYTCHTNRLHKAPRKKKITGIPEKFR